MPDPFLSALPYILIATVWSLSDGNVIPGVSCSSGVKLAGIMRYSANLVYYCLNCHPS